MSGRSLRDRVAALERAVARLTASAENGASPKDWRRTVGMFTDDPGMQRLFERALKLREADRARARCTGGRRRPSQA